MKRKWWQDRQAVSPAEAIARRVRTRARESERRVLAGRVGQVLGLAEEIEELRAKAAAEPVANRSPTGAEPTEPAAAA